MQTRRHPTEQSQLQHLLDPGDCQVLKMIISFRSIVLSILWGIVPGVHAIAASADQSATPPNASPRLTATFIQLLEGHGRWSDSRWADLFGALQSIGIHDLVVQWSVLDGTAYYSSRTLPFIASAPLEKVLAGADQNGMRVLVGLAHDTAYWTNIERSSAETASYLKNLRSRSIAAANE